jgi:hypothetical protein
LGDGVEKTGLLGQSIRQPGLGGLQLPHFESIGDKIRGFQADRKLPSRPIVV